MFSVRVRTSLATVGPPLPVQPVPVPPKPVTAAVPPGMPPTTSVPPASVTGPVPSRPGAAEDRDPALTVTPPLKVLGLLRVSVPVPDLTNPPPAAEPLAIAPAKVVLVVPLTVSVLPLRATLPPEAPVREAIV